MAKLKTGVIDVGGGFRGIYGAAVLDACLDHDIRFDYCIGVSAGSANLASYLGRQKGRNIDFYIDYGFRKEYAGVKNFVTKHSYIDLDYVYGTLSNTGGESPLDYDTLAATPAEFVVVATNALTGEPVYLPKDLLAQDHYDAFKASSALPIACHPYTAAGIPCFDGGLSDPVPLQKAFAAGCDRVVLILTKPRHAALSTKRDRMAARALRLRYPRAAAQLMTRDDKYAAGVALAEQYEKQGKLLIVAPDDTCGMTTLHRTRQSLEKMYQKGYRDAAAIEKFLA